VSLGSALVLVTALGVIVLDILVASPWTGLPVVLGMGLVTVAVAEQVRQLIAARRGTAGLAGVIWFEGSLLLALLGFLIARILVLTAMFEGATERQIAAAETYNLVFTSLAAIAGGLVIAPERSGRVLLNMAQKPATALIGSFAVMIAGGSLLLTLPLSVTELGHVSFVDALFTMTSAVCVTGLAVNDVGATFTLFGQGVILTGIQLGGIGIMTVAALALAFTNNTSLQSQLRYAAMLDARTLADLRAIVVAILAGTFVIEAIGALALWSLLAGDPRLDGQSALWMAVFHSVSAFCNAGFSLFPGGMTKFAGDLGVQLVIMLLIVFGGLGFPVMMELARHGWRTLGHAVRRGPHPPPLSLTTRLVGTWTLALIAIGTLVVFVLEFSASLAPTSELGPGGRLLAALFASVNTRTAGFNTVDIAAMRDATLLVTCVLMFIGGAPMSTAGGIKTTTFAAVVAALRGELRGREPELGGRAVPPEVLRKAIAVVMMMGGLALLITLLLTLTEEQPFIRLVFEAVSALATVGLSTGITPALTIAGKLIVAAAMFLGRVGPFTIALAIADKPSRQRYRLARESFPVG
jgi:trk system potassium uptake protein TrkH